MILRGCCGLKEREKGNGGRSVLVAESKWVDHSDLCWGPEGLRTFCSGFAQDLCGDLDRDYVGVRAGCGGNF